MTEGQFKIQHVPGGVKVTCRRCFMVRRGGWRRLRAVVPSMADVGPWVDQHECTPFQTVDAARREAIRMNRASETPSVWELHEEMERRAKRAALDDIETMSQGLLEHKFPCARCGAPAVSSHVRNSPSNDTHVEMITLCGLHTEPEEDDFRLAVLAEARIPF